jgi:hypothetical protein
MSGLNAKSEIAHEGDIGPMHLETKIPVHLHCRIVVSINIKHPDIDAA